MKKIAVLLLSILLLLIIGLISTFYWRKHQAKKQYISRQSTAVLAIGIDDYAVDNLYDLLKSSGKQKTSTDKDRLKAKDIFFKSGLSIPSRVFLFTTDAAPNQLFGHLAVDNYEKALTFFQQHFKEKVTPAESTDAPVAIRFNAHTVALLTKKDFVILLSQSTNPSTDALQALLVDKEALVEVQSFTQVNPAIFKAHLAFSSLTQDFSLSAMVKHNQLLLNGEWELEQALAGPLKARQTDSTQAVLTFWNNLPLAEVPLFAKLLTSYTGLDEQSLATHYADYIDLEVLDQQTQQTDTIITYSYDDDFNAKEEHEVRQLSVPQITQVWNNEKGISSFLPDRMFYNFYQKEENGFIINSTFTTGHAPLVMMPTEVPLSLTVNFQKWPSAWAIGLFKELKESACKVHLQAVKHSDKKLVWKGQASWNP